MRNLRNFFIIALVMLFVALASTTAEAQTGNEERFPNGYVIKGEFLRFYRSAPDPWFLFGYPISNELDMNGKPVQYFDRARFELVNTDKGPTVQLAKLGWFLFDENKVVNSLIPESSSTCRFFPKFSHNVCFKFLQFYDAHNGPIYFGEPVSEAVLINDQIVQYFEYTRLEWRTNMGDSDLSIGMTNVGWLAMRRYLGIVPIGGPSLISSVPVEQDSFQVRAFVSHALVAPNSENTLFVVVQTLDYKPLKNASVNVSLDLKDGKRNYAEQLKTDANGIARLTITLKDVPSKQIVPIQVSVVYEGKTIRTSTWYRVWY